MSRPVGNVRERIRRAVSSLRPELEEAPEPGLEPEEPPEGDVLWPAASALTPHAHER